jgi:hypothetical protein
LCNFFIYIYIITNHANFHGYLINSGHIYCSGTVQLWKQTEVRKISSLIDSGLPPSHYNNFSYLGFTWQMALIHVLFGWPWISQCYMDWYSEQEVASCQLILLFYYHPFWVWDLNIMGYCGGSIPYNNLHI